MPNYSKDKNGWVKFTNSNRKKIKLRKYITRLAISMNVWNETPILKNKTALIAVYNAEGLKSVEAYYIQVARDSMKSIQEAQDKLKEQQK